MCKNTWNILKWHGKVLMALLANLWILANAAWLFSSISSIKMSKSFPKKIFEMTRTTLSWRSFNSAAVHNSFWQLMECNLDLHWIVYKYINIYIDGAYVWAIMSFAKLTPPAMPRPRERTSLWLWLKNNHVSVKTKNDDIWPASGRKLAQAGSRLIDR